MITKRTFWELLVVFVIVTIALNRLSPTSDQVNSAKMGSQESTTRLIHSVSALTSDFFGKVVAENEGKNVFVSAFSLSSALTMCAVGARENTQKEMLRVLHLDMDPEQLPAAYGGLSTFFNVQGGPVQLNNANRLWIDKSFPIHQAFVDATGKHFDASAESCDFVHSAENERQKINQWVEKQTNNKIKNLIPPNGVNSGTALALTNAIYFKANWVRRFDQQKSAQGDFTLLSKEKIRVTYMNDKYKIPFTHQGDYSAIEKNYTSPSGKSLSMVFILPEDHGVEGLKKAMAALKPAKPNQPPHFLTQLFPEEVAISIPKFKMEFEVDASRVLQDLGMKSAFGNADFSGISSNKLAISQVFHKAFVEVNEEGTEAAAATAVVMMRSAALRKENTFIAKRPFIFLIWDRSSGLILFTGLVNKPE